MRTALYQNLRTRLIGDKSSPLDNPGCIELEIALYVNSESDVPCCAGGANKSHTSGESVSSSVAV